MNEKLKILIIDEDNNSRMRLREALKNVSTRATIFIAPNLMDAVRINKKEKPNVVFLASNLGEEYELDLTNSLGSGKAMDTRFVMILKGQHQSKASIAKNFAFGVDGFISEPYSVDALTSVIALVQNEEKKNTEKRKDAALSMLLDHSATLIDKIALGLVSKQGAGLDFQNLRKNSEALERLYNANPEKYAEHLVDAFEDLGVSRMYTIAKEKAAYEEQQRLKEKMRLEAEEKARKEKEKASGPKIIYRS